MLAELWEFPLAWIVFIWSWKNSDCLMLWSCQSQKFCFLNFHQHEHLTQLKAIKTLRKAGIKSDIYPDTGTSNNQQKKQWKYLEKRGIPFVVSGIKDGQFILKDVVAQYNRALLHHR